MQETTCHDVTEIPVQLWKIPMKILNTFLFSSNKNYILIQKQNRRFNKNYSFRKYGVYYSLIRHER